MPDLIIKPTAGSGNKLILQDQGGDAILTSTDGKGFIVGKTATAPSSPAVGQMFFDTTSNVLRIYNGTTWAYISTSAEGSGGTESLYTGFKAHIFTGDDSFTVSGGSLICDILIVGGGGGGGSGTGGGAGGGAVLYKSGHSITSGTYTITIADGGGGASSADSAGYQGGNSVAFGVTATGGGAGWGETVVSGHNRDDGANGGGSNHSSDYGQGTAPTASGWSVYAGYDGGVWGGLWVTPGGGGGAGANGGSGGSTSGANPLTHGGIGVQIGAITDGTNNYYWGAGGGGAVTSWSSYGGTGGNGGLGGGGAGGNTESIAHSGGGSALNSGGAQSGGLGGVGGANTGGGAGGSSDNQTIGADGGSGIVVIRYSN